MKKNEKKLNDLKNDIEAMSDDELNEVAGGIKKIPPKMGKAVVCRAGFHLDPSGKCVPDGVTEQHK